MYAEGNPKKLYCKCCRARRIRNGEKNCNRNKYQQYCMMLYNAHSLHLRKCEEIVEKHKKLPLHVVRSEVE